MGYSCKSVSGSSLVRLFDVITPQSKFKMKKVSEELYRGSNPDADVFPELAEKGIKHILNLRTISRDEFNHNLKLASRNGLSYTNIPINPFNVKKSIMSIIQELFNITLKNPTFVHCKYGQDRTGLVVALYRSLKQGWSTEKAIEEMKNNGFKSFLIPGEKFLKSLKKTVLT